MRHRRRPLTAAVRQRHPPPSIQTHRWRSVPPSPLRQSAVRTSAAAVPRFSRAGTPATPQGRRYGSAGCAMGRDRGPQGAYIFPFECNNLRPCPMQLSIASLFPFPRPKQHSPEEHSSAGGSKEEAGGSNHSFSVGGPRQRTMRSIWRRSESVSARPPWAKSGVRKTSSARMQPTCGANGRHWPEDRALCWGRQLGSASRHCP